MSEEFYGLLIAVECIQEVLFANRLQDPAGLIKQYRREAEQYVAVGREEVAAPLKILIDRLSNPDRLARRILVQSKAVGQA
jgi:hypothetical protein